MKLQYKSELESLALLGPDGARLVYTACKLGRLAAGTRAIRTMAKFLDPNNPYMVTSFKRAIGLARNAIEEVKYSRACTRRGGTSRTNIEVYP